jgi:hypothetical protein
MEGKKLPEAVSFDLEKIGGKIFGRWKCMYLKDKIDLL